MDLSTIWLFINDYIIGFIILICVLVFVHELGHYLFAKLFKVRVESFSIGFGPELIGWSDKSGTRWKICPIPLGGFVKMKGEMIQSNETLEQDSFQAKNLWQKFLIVFAGPLFNLLLPLFVLFFISYFAGLPTLKPIVGSVVEKSPAVNILHPKDEIKKIDNMEMNEFTQLQKYVAAHPNKNLVLDVIRNGKPLTLKLKSGNNNGTGFLGVIADNTLATTQKYELRKSFEYTYKTYWNVLTLMIQGFGKLFTGKVGLNDIGGPIKIAQLSGQTMQQGGVEGWLFFVALLSINLALINLFPIPALDGGYLLLYIVQAITRRPLSTKVQNALMQGGFVFLLILMLFVVLKDIISLI